MPVGALSAAPTPVAPLPDTPAPPLEVRICHLVANPDGETVQSAVFGAAAMFADLSVAAILLGCLLALFRFGEHMVGAVLGRGRSLGRAETGDVA